MRPSPSTTHAAAEQRLLHSQILSEHEDWKAEKDRLQVQLGEAENQIASLSAAEKAAIERIAQLENIIDVLVWRLVRLDKSLGPELEEALRATATGNRNHGLILISKLNLESGEGEISGR